ncbi:unnamed protein product [Paramecium pentaurelia]|uniref:Uncharacterized protein n=1 Tax=Paramecium pentaurelia TaxID=43138 RepID=A0A8S1VZG0_9CILI|nr:unnamed protein product [Paramecium pentaurelia]
MYLNYQMQYLDMLRFLYIKAIMHFNQYESKKASCSTKSETIQSNCDNTVITHQVNKATYKNYCALDRTKQGMQGSRL